jgi:hypothetical protein
MAPSRTKNGALPLVIGSIVTSATASVCCWLPALLGASAAGSAGLAHWFMPARPYLLALSALMIGRGLWLAYARKPKECCTAEEGTLRRRVGIVTMWATAAFAVVMATLPVPETHSGHNETAQDMPAVSHDHGAQ